MTYKKGILLVVFRYNKPMEIHVGDADDTVIFAHGEGKGSLTCCDGDNSAILVLHKTLYVPELAKNLISVLGYIIVGKLYRVNFPLETINSDVCGR